MKGAALVAIAATIGNFLQGWDNATIAGAIVYIKKDLALGTSVEGLVVAMSLIGATAITTCSGAISDWLGRRPMLIISSMLYFVSGLIMLWSPNVFVLCIARLLDGFGIGLAVTLIPLYISETAPSEIRGLLNTLPQFAGSGGMFLSYCMIFGMSLTSSPSWRLMLGVLSIPSLLYFALTVFYLPESPRWLVSKGKMREAKLVLQRLRGRADVQGEMALLVEGLAIGGETSIEEYIIGPAEDELAAGYEADADKDKIRLYGPEAGISWVARPVTGQSSLALISRHGSVDPLVTLFGSIHEKFPETGSTRSMLFPNFGSMFSMAEHQVKDERWDEESLQREGEGEGEDEDYTSEAARGDSDDDLHSPLISRQTTSIEKDMPRPTSHGSILSMRPHSSLMQGEEEAVGSMGIGGGWQLAWKLPEKERAGERSEAFKRIYLHQEGALGSQRGSLVSLPGGDVREGEYIQAAALVSQPALYSKELLDQHPIGPAMVHPAETASKWPTFAALFEPGVKHALIVGVFIQLLQQFSGINGVLYYTPQILEDAGVEVLLADLGISSESASFLISAFTTFLMLPCIGVAMRLMDISGRRQLLLTTIPVLIVSLIILILSELINLGSVVKAAISTACVIIYFCCFVSAYGPIPNILCAEIFPTRVRGVCIAICALFYWVSDIIVTYTLPVLLSSIGLAGLFGIYAVVCVISWIFVYLKVPETKGMPLEVITEFFAVGAKAVASKNEGGDHGTVH
ncbi:Tonoplast monosaccharide transporter2 isoform 1 [Tripterygium wilfordii]|uniref:Tonoplast monosaccharide transporter2 isoform 1 n=1 Tax=Tripterygium wilfordii TaxID=458696 RepID=A0A7J7DLZ6_TRIWF|nr:monosaccharide-sensing protein 2-like [Tripterygium wilfordii]XP_038703980.1 monosaccharide-sensing protein 2-like [Tripterygium wilfordii]KAF5747254.1 Tonoplast monosaccharide transporter2 isoform 1 [Tripterygium wilfordii]